MKTENKTTQTTKPAIAVEPVLTAGNFKPILFSTPMVQAILRGEKTQTRRIIKIEEGEKIEFDNSEFRKCFLIVGNGYIKALKCKYKVGDILWVRETFCPVTIGYAYKADGVYIENHPAWVWKPSIFMPKDACRIFLKLKSIRIEKLNNISESNAINEGVIELLQSRAQLVTNGNLFFDYSKKKELFNEGLTAKESYRTLFQKINGEKSWLENPFVWVYEFERTDASFACS
jgi:hypothetical protein